MADTYYCDINQLMPSGDGSVFNPYNANQFLDAVFNSTADADFFIKGEMVCAVWDTLSGDDRQLKIAGWDTSAYGNPSLDSLLFDFGGRNQNIEFDSVNISIESNEGVYNGNALTFRNCHLTEVYDLAPTSAYFYGCTFSKFFYLWDYEWNASAYAMFKDCAFSASNIYINEINNQVVIENCLFADDSISATNISSTTLVENDNVYGWSPSMDLPSITSTHPNDLKYSKFVEDANVQNPWTDRQIYWSANSFDSGACGSVRRGYGNFYFDDLVFVDLNGTSSGVGSETSPLGIEDLNNYTYSNGNVFKLKGSATLVKFPVNPLGDQGSSVKIVPWEVSANGPWRISASEGIGSNLNESISINGGIINSGISAVNVTIRNCHIEKENLEIWAENISSYGSNVVSTSSVFINNDGSSGNAYFKDSAIDTPSISDGSGGLLNLHVYDCAVSASSIATLEDSSNQFNSVSANDNQYGWVPPSWPGFGAVKDGWKYTVLGDDISISGSGGW